MSTIGNGGLAVPDWARVALGRYLRFSRETQALFEVTQRALHQLSVSADLIRTSAELAGHSPLALANDLAAVEHAKRVMGDDLSLLRSHTVVALWGAAEVFVEDLATDFLVHDPEAFTDVVKRVKITAADTQLDRVTLMRHLVSMLQRDLRADLRRGVGRFESVIGAIGLREGTSDRFLDRAVAEVSAVRNLIVHRGSVVDRQFNDACPWLRMTTGDVFVIDRDRHARYSRALLTYAVNVQCRIMERFGVGIPAPMLDESGNIADAPTKPAET